MDQKKDHQALRKDALELFQNGEFGEAATKYEAICEENPEDQNAWMMLGRCYMGFGNYKEAISSLEKADDVEPPSAEVLYYLGQAYLSRKRIIPAIESFEEALEVDPQHEVSCIALGQNLLMLGRYREVAEKYREFVERFPENVEIRCQFAVALEQLNRLDEARKAAEAVLAVQPDHARAGFVLARIENRKGKLPEARDRLSKLLRLDLPPQQYSSIASELGSVLDKMGEYSAAFQAFQAANWALIKTIDTAAVDLDGIFQTIDLYRGYFSEEITTGWENGYGAEDSGRQDPIFLVGFPRSGTMLTEQILATAEEVIPSDEKPVITRLILELSLILDRPVNYPLDMDEWSDEDLRKIRSRYWELAEKMIRPVGEGERLLEKLPLNLLELGFIYRIFPGARVIVVLRDPRDACLSCFMHSFVLNQAMVNFLDLERTARFYAAVMDLWTDYRSFMKFPFLEIRYEDLVADPESESKRLFDFTGLNWSEEVLRFFEHTGERDITTPSYSAVAKPIYEESIGRWEKYRNFLAPISQTLKLYVERFGYPPDILPAGMAATSILPENVRQAFSPAGGVGCSFALIPTGKGDPALGVVAAVPAEGRMDGKGFPKVSLRFELYNLSKGIVLQIILTVSGFFPEPTEMDILIDPLDPKQAEILDRLCDEDAVGIAFYDAKSGELVGGNEVMVDEILAGRSRQVLEEARKYGRTLKTPDFRAAVFELAQKLSIQSP